MIKITLDKELDKETFLNFFDLKVGGVDFGAKITKEHPYINKHNYQEYINSYYEENNEKLIKSLSKINNLAQEREKDFFNAVNNIFKQDFSSKEYAGALSIFDCNPRYLDRNIFQVYYKRNDQDKLRVIFHEILHFIFFDYCDIHCKTTTIGLDKDKGKYWDLSEIFNVIILNSPSFQKITGKVENIFYPKHEEFYPAIEKLWREHGNDVKRFVEESLTILP